MIDGHLKRVKPLVERLTLENKINLMCQYQEDIPELGIGKYKHGTEAAHGISWLGKATMFPQPIGLAGTWDKELLKKVGEVIGIEARGFYARDPEVNGLTLWAPTIDLNRDPRWGRTDEGYGEDPILVANMASALINGIQGDDPKYLRAAATLKHFYGNNNEIDRGFCSTNISERIKREYYLKVFKLVIDKTQVMSMMTAYNSVNGVPANIHPDLHNIVRDEWGWPGFVVSDAGDVLSLISEHKYVENTVDAVSLSIKAGIDSITDDHDISKKALREALDCGKLVEEDLDKAITRALLVRSMIGEFNKNNPYSNITEDIIGAEEHGKVAHEASKKSIVLLKNSNKILPLTSKDTGISLLGNMADRIYRDWYSGEFLYEVTADKAFKNNYARVSVCDGNDRVTIQDNTSGLYLSHDGSFTKEPTIFEMEEWGWGATTFRYPETKKYLTSLDNSISCEADSIFGWFTKEVFYTKQSESTQIITWNNVDTYVEDAKLAFKHKGATDGDIGISASTPLNPVYAGEGNFSIKQVSDGISKAVEMAENTKYPIVIVGNHPLINGKETIDRHDLVLAKRQIELANKVIDINKDAILVLIGSYPFALGELKEKYSTILYASHLGQEFGNAIVDVISGKENPSGRLPLTWYKSSKDLGDIMDYELPTGGKTYLYYKGDVEYPFGHGLNYSNIEYSDLKVNNKTIRSNDNIELSFKIKNSGPYDAREVVQIYIKHYGNRVIRPIQQLVDFEKVLIKNGESKIIEFVVSASEFNYWDEDSNKFQWEKGYGEIFISKSSRNNILKQKLELA
ncbi:beta-glucosidase [Thiospirochaeta perfilievii]|uniref:Beta-glucosidase n=1 Tax=Thiospirochaeta perfilievii TaxID=252967 RepID=A0A5C1QCI6_9SPIO|nr:glycoside hydrolase family 3 N-terminal domain-containing protein [Thiospirochaeta perfilievii]QEN04376.1 beta-glucosidase [Thiospirochaeta perfilievii]